MRRFAAECRRRQIILHGITIIERRCADALVAAERRIEARIARRLDDAMKTDRRDALKLARLHRSGELVAVWVPDEEQEAMRDLTPAREDMKAIEFKARQRLGAFLLRHARVYRKRCTTQLYNRLNEEIERIHTLAYRHAVCSRHAAPWTRRGALRRCLP